MAAYGQTQYSPALQPGGPYTPYSHHTQGYSMPSYNIKTEDGLSHSPGQTGLLGYSNFSGTPSSQALYSYSTHGAGISSGIFQGTNAIAASTPFNPAQQDFSAYSSYSQSQYSPYYNHHYNNPYITAGSNISPASIATPLAYQHPEHPAMLPNHSPDSHTGEYHPPPSPPTPGKEDGVSSRRGANEVKLRGRKRVSDPAPPLDSDIERVFIWDLDETIIIFHSLLTGTFSTRFGKDSSKAVSLGLWMEEMIFNLADSRLFFNDLEECDQVHIDDVASDDNGQDLSFHGAQDLRLWKIKHPLRPSVLLLFEGRYSENSTLETTQRYPISSVATHCLVKSPANHQVCHTQHYTVNHILQR